MINILHAEYFNRHHCLAQEHTKIKAHSESSTRTEVFAGTLLSVMIF